MVNLINQASTHITQVFTNSAVRNHLTRHTASAYSISKVALENIAVGAKNLSKQINVEFIAKRMHGDEPIIALVVLSVLVFFIAIMGASASRRRSPQPAGHVIVHNNPPPPPRRSEDELQALPTHRSNTLVGPYPLPTTPRRQLPAARPTPRPLDYGDTSSSEPLFALASNRGPAESNLTLAPGPVRSTPAPAPASPYTPLVTNSNQLRSLPQGRAQPSGHNRTTPAPTATVLALPAGPTSGAIRSTPTPRQHTPVSHNHSHQPTMSSHPTHSPSPTKSQTSQGETMFALGSRRPNDRGR